MEDPGKIKSFIIWCSLYASVKLSKRPALPPFLPLELRELDVEPVAVCVAVFVLQCGLNCRARCNSAVQHVAVRCSAVQHVAACCNACLCCSTWVCCSACVCCSLSPASHCNILQHTVTRSVLTHSVLQCVERCCKSVAVRCKCVAACCSVSSALPPCALRLAVQLNHSQKSEYNCNITLRASQCNCNTLDS